MVLSISERLLKLKFGGLLPTHHGEEKRRPITPRDLKDLSRSGVFSSVVRCHILSEHERMNNPLYLF